MVVVLNQDAFIVRLTDYAFGDERTSRTSEILCVYYRYHSDLELADIFVILLAIQVAEPSVTVVIAGDRWKGRRSKA